MRLTHLGFALTVCATLVGAQPSGSAARTAARTFREKNEGKILQEFRELLSIPNVATNHADIRRNADLLMAMLRRRGAETQLLEVPGGPVSVYGALMTPGATRTVVLYAHFDGQPVDARQWEGQPFTPILRSDALFRGGQAIPFPSEGQRVQSPEARIYARSASDDKGSVARARKVIIHSVYL